MIDKIKEILRMNISDTDKLERISDIVSPPFSNMEEDEDFYFDPEDEADREMEEKMQLSADCICGAWVNGLHVADCCCGAE